MIASFQYLETKMKSIKTSHLDEMKNTKIRISRTSGRLSNWKHSEHENLPQLTYSYDENSSQFSGKEDQLIEFRNNFWSLVNSEEKTYAEQYEYDLRQGLNALLESLDKKFNDEFSKEIDKEFNK
jgi:hypothetical protein